MDKCRKCGSEYAKRFELPVCLACGARLRKKPSVSAFMGSRLSPPVPTSQ